MNEKQHTILVVDDDALLRMHVSDVLIDAGYRVLEASDTDMALKIILEQRGEITLLFTDVQMPPGADGLELSASVQARWPHVLLLVASGDLDPSDDDVPDGGEFVAKPYQDKKIVGHIARLHRRSASAP